MLLLTLLMGGAMAEPSCDLDAADFPGVTALGDFAYDLGCTFRAVRIGVREGSLAEMTPVGLAAAGWSTASASQKQALARAWSEQVALAHVRPVTTANDGRAFPPLSVSEDGDQIVVQVWVAGATTARETRYHHYQLRYAASDGAVEGPTELGRHSVSVSSEAPAPILQLKPD